MQWEEELENIENTGLPEDKQSTFDFESETLIKKSSQQFKKLKAQPDSDSVISSSCVTTLEDVSCEKIETFLILLAPKNNFWIKSKKIELGKKTPDIKIGYFFKAYFNYKFMLSFHDNIVNHPRCVFGIWSASKTKNIKKAVEALCAEIPGYKGRVLVFDQSCCDFKYTDNKKKDHFKRNFTKLSKELNKRGFTQFDQKNILLLDWETDKCTSMKENTLYAKVFPEDYFNVAENKQQIYQQRGQILIKYLTKLLNNCEYDVRNYLKLNPLRN